MVEFLRQNWFFILVVLLMIACHLFPGHGGHDDHEQHEREKRGGRR